MTDDAPSSLPSDPPPYTFVVEMSTGESRTYDGECACVVNGCLWITKDQLLIAAFQPNVWCVFERKEGLGVGA